VQIEETYPLIVTDRLAEARDFYLQRLDMEVTFETDWVVYVSRPIAGGARTGVCFMAPGLEHQIPEHREAYSGSSVILTFQVEDVRRALDALRSKGFEPDVDLADEPWGQRHFMMRDPAGVWVDVVQQIEPIPGFFAADAPAQVDVPTR
jgi:catechol 2,3-dioxygenase-like lactoylglutathione lyase family enzyme